MTKPHIYISQKFLKRQFLYFLREAYLVVYQTQMGKRFPIYWEHVCLPPIFSTNHQIWPKTAFLLDEICVIRVTVLEERHE